MRQGIARIRQAFGGLSGFDGHVINMIQIAANICSLKCLCLPMCHQSYAWQC